MVSEGSGARHRRRFSLQYSHCHDKKSCLPVCFIRIGWRKDLFSDHGKSSLRAGDQTIILIYILRYQYAKIWKLLVVAAAFATVFFVSAILSRATYNTDFPAFYSAASTILDPKASNKDVYRDDVDTRYPIPEKKEVQTIFIYSLPVAFLLAPLAWMPYYTAKAVMIFLNIVSYLSAVTIILTLGKVSGRWMGWGIGLSCLWLPFINNLGHAQINGIILLLVAVGVLAVTRGYPLYSGVLLALAALFKLFPLAIALVLGLRARRILTGFALIFGASFLLPGAKGWISTIWKWGKVEAPLYVWLKTFSPALVVICPILIGSVTALITLMANDDDYPLLTAFAIPAVLLSMPRLGHYHLTLLVFSLGYLFSSKESRSWPLLGFLVLSSIILGFPRPGPVSPFVFDPVTPVMYLTIFSLWVVLGIRISLRSFSPSPVIKG